MSEVNEGHQSEDMAEEATNQGRKDGDSTEKGVLYPEGGCSPSKDSTLTKEEKSHLSEASVESHGDGIHKAPKNENPSIIKKQNSENSEGETPLKSCEEESKDSDPAQKQQHMVTADSDSPEKEEKDEKEGFSPDDGSKQMEKKTHFSQDNVQHNGDEKKDPPKNEPKSDKSHTPEQEAPKPTASPIPDDKKDDQEGGTKIKLNEEIPDRNDTDAESGAENASASGKAQVTQESPPSPQITSVKQQLDEDSNEVETIGPTTPEAVGPAVPEITGGKRKLLAVGVVLVVVFAILVQHFFQQESPPQTSDLCQIDVFLKQLEKVKTRFPNQRAELWNRSRIHLKRHLQTAEPTEPVSLILTAGLRAERTLICLAQGLADAFSSALNASFLHIDGTSKASQDSDQVKLDIDRKLQGAFEGDTPVAIIHRFEELPPGSTLIFYRYCDHENAAYKKTFLLFTVLLGEEEEIPANISLSAVEEMVDDHLQKKFLSHGQPVSFDMMDLDKYGGLWSRISHLILPVATEKRIELEGC
ncbi:torsin-1A-interacting protein 2-like isoform X1 [Archocentrus centrarchus]|uniref:torsin-1A-interacting protein 2-like isoform X1 n=1 Tax=Archocentrus centrarchus TaxID=63155 RepID=UPI0011E9F090|nr:torsin-1A-interacting protein 2-like isoform X1 [Archocentrus centrarchus]